MPVYAELSSSAIVVSPGGEEVERLTIRNLGSATESYAVVPLGMCAGWTLIDPPTLTLFPGEEQTLKVTLRPPRSPSVAAGDSVLALRIVPHGQPDDATTIEASLTVLAFAQRRLSVLQPVQRARRRATYDIVLENHGNAQASCRLVVGDSGGRVSGRFDPPSIGVDPGQNATSQLHISTKGVRWQGGTGTVAFAIEAVQDGFAPAATEATLLQPTVLSRRTMASVAWLIAAALALGAAWTWLVHPAIEDAASNAVADEIASAPSPATTAPPDITTPETDDSGPINTVTTPTDTGGPVGTESVGTPVAIPIDFTTTVGETATQAFTAKRSQRVEITDIVFQNPNNDLGVVTISNNGQRLFTVPLDSVFGLLSQPLDTPIVVQPGKSLTIDVRCTGAGDATIGVCSPSVLFSGRVTSV